MVYKLYPPYIEGTLPAFCLSYDSSNTAIKGATIEVPFTPNSSVGDNEVAGLMLRMRTASTGSYLFAPIPSASFSASKGIATFILTADQAKMLNEGQYYKIQIAYISTDTLVGYFSTVGIIKCTSKPKIYINNLSQESANFFTNYYVGTYDQSECKDQSEKVYSYEFIVYNDDDEIVYTTGEKLHQSSYDVDYTYSVDKAIIKDFNTTGITYSIQYKVTTLNNLQLSTPKYKLTNEDLVSPNQPIDILPESNQDNGYITIHFKGDLDLNKSWHYILKKDILDSEKVDGYYIKDANGRTALSIIKDSLMSVNNKINFLKKYSLFKIYSQSYKDPGFLYAWADNEPMNKTLYNNRYYDTTLLNDILNNIELSEEQKQQKIDKLIYYSLISSGRNLVNNLSYKYVKDNYIDLKEYDVVQSVPYEAFYYGSYILSRSSDKDNYSSWETIAQFRLDEQAPSQFSIRDMTVEHGRKYIYGLQQTNIWGLISSRIKSKPYEVSFEDMFLFDGDKLLKIKFNPKMESFKTTILEQKTNTLGGKFPYITRNGATYYKEFPLGGLIACEMDEDQMFHKRIQGVAHRHSTSVVQEKYDENGNLIQVSDLPENATRDWHMFSDENIFLEREFKLAVLEWLNNGQPKLFKSPYEGNYIVRLMNNELKPVEELGRMLHNFTSNAVEIADCTYENLVEYGFLNVNSPSKYVGLWRSYQLGDPDLLNTDGNTEIIFDAGLETFTVQDLMPGDIIYLEFFDGTIEPIMIGITGSYTYTVGVDKPVKKLTISSHSEIDQTSFRNTSGLINCYYQGVRITAFDAILSQQLKTIPSQQYIGVSPWLERTKRIQWDTQDNYGNNSFDLTNEQYKEFQDYNFRDYLDDIVDERDNSNNKVITYKINDNFQKYMYSFDPGELLEKINLTLNRGEVYKTQLLNIEQAKFRLRDIIPVYIISKTEITDAADFKYQKKDGPYADAVTVNYQYEVATSPYGYPHRIEELTKYEMIDPYCIFEVFDRLGDSNKTWFPIQRQGGPYYDPYYRTWANGYDPTYKINYQWKKIVWAPDDYTLNILTEYKDRELRKKDRDIVYDDSYIFDYIVYKELTVDNEDDSKKVYKFYYNDNRGNKVEIKDGFDLFYKEGTNIFSFGNSRDILGNIGLSQNLTEKEIKQQLKNYIYYIKEYDSIISLATIKEKDYKNLKNINSIHIGNGVIAELTFQIKIIDYYTEVKDAKVREAKQAYLDAKNFYINLMKSYAIIANANYYQTKYASLRNMYNILLNGTSSGAKLSQVDYDNLKKILSNSYEVEQLNVLRLYNVETINSELDVELINKLIEYKQNHLENEDERYGMTSAKIFVSNIENTIFYYVIDKNDIIIPNIYKDSEENLNVNNYTYFRQTALDNTVTYYGINNEVIYNLYKQANPTNFININNLTLIYNDTYNSTNINEFIGNTDNLLNKNILKIEKIVEFNDNFIQAEFSLLNNEEVEKIKKENNFIYLELVNLMNEKTFYELETLNEYVNQEIVDVEGVNGKVIDLQKEVDKFNNELNSLSDLLNSEKATYIQLFNDLNALFNNYNDIVYTSWAYQELIRLTTKNQNTESIASVLTGQSQEIKDNFDKIAYRLDSLLLAAKNLYYLILDNLPKIARYEQMKKDGSNDDDLDNYLEKQIIEKRGEVILCALAMYEAVYECIDIIKGNSQYQIWYKDQLLDVINCYYEIFNLLTENGIMSNNYYNAITDESQTSFLYTLIEDFKNNYNKEADLMEKSFAYTNPEQLAKLCNIYDDLHFLYTWRANQNISNEIIFDNLNYSVLKIKLPENKNNFNIQILNNCFVGNKKLSNPLNTLANQIYYYSAYQKVVFSSGKLLGTYFYHTPLTESEDFHMEASLAIYTTFLFYPLATTYKDTNDQEHYIKDPMITANQFYCNKDYFDSLTLDQQQEVLRVNQILTQKMLDFISNKTDRMGEYNDLANYIFRTYFYDSNGEKDYHPNTVNNKRVENLQPTQATNDSNELPKDNSYTIFNNKILYIQSQLDNPPDPYLMLIPSSGTRNYFLMGHNYFKNFVNSVYPNAENIQAQSLVYSLKDMEKIGNVYTDPISQEQIIQEEYEDIGPNSEKQIKQSLYSQYLKKLSNDDIDDIKKLLKQASQLLKLYKQQYENYQKKYAEYNKIYEEYRTIFSQYQGTEEMRYYLSEGEITMEDYRKKVREAWGAFLNILDYTYSREREKGLYA